MEILISSRRVASLARKLTKMLQTVTEDDEKKKKERALTWEASLEVKRICSKDDFQRRSATYR